MACHPPPLPSLKSLRSSSLSRGSSSFPLSFVSFSSCASHDLRPSQLAALYLLVREHQLGLGNCPSVRAPWNRLYGFRLNGPSSSSRTFDLRRQTEETGDKSNTETLAVVDVLPLSSAFSNQCELRALLGAFSCSGSPGPVYRLRDPTTTTTTTPHDEGATEGGGGGMSQVHQGKTGDILATLSSDGRRLFYTTTSSTDLRSVEVKVEGRVALGDRQTTKLTVCGESNGVIMRADSSMSPLPPSRSHEGDISGSRREKSDSSSSLSSSSWTESFVLPAKVDYGEVQHQIEQSDLAAMNPFLAAAQNSASGAEAASGATTTPQRPGKTLLGYVFTDDPTAEGHSSVEVTASMNGKIVKIDVQEGSQVSQGDPVAVIEAMKMESVLRAPVTGTVGLIRVRPGDAVSQNQALISLVPDKESRPQ
eukprot:GHVS01014094.1.p1 GENE.GHVS01014094.1~~GHVS01014094.1.p1  ORF type:complete len:421 (+),score=73.56 GHVS01014094.1:224-1486(+)